MKCIVTTPLQRVLMTSLCFLVVSYSVYYPYVHAEENVHTETNCGKIFNLRTAEGFNDQGLERLRKGDYDGAIMNFDKAIELKPDFAEAFYNRGHAYFGKGEINFAMDDYNTAIQQGVNRSDTNAKKPFPMIEVKTLNEFNPSNFDSALYPNIELDIVTIIFESNKDLSQDFVGIFYRGNDHAKKGEFDLAIDNYNKAIQLNPDFAEAFNNRGLMYFIKGEFDLAMDDYDTAIQLNPFFFTAWKNRSKTLTKKETLHPSL